jgi:hypothetical protein
MPQQAPVRRRRPTAPSYPRRVSGPVRAQALPAGVALPPRTGVFERIRALPDRRVVDRLLRGRLCIWVIGVMLGGIVAMQVSLLRLNAGISRAVIAEQTLERQNSDLQGSTSRALSSDRIAAAALANNMIDPPAGETSWLTARPAQDPLRALRHMKPPSEAAAGIMANGGKVPGALSQTPTAGSTAVTPAAATTTTTAAATTTAAVAPAATPVPTPVATVAPVVTPVPATVQSTNGATAAPEG